MRGVSRALFIRHEFEQTVDHDAVELATRLRICQEFGWTLDYLDTLDDWTIAGILGVMDGWHKIRRRQMERKR